MILDFDTAAGIVTKRAESPGEVSRLRTEAAILSDAQHPGMVELIGTGSGELSLRAVEGVCLADWWPDGSGAGPGAEIVALGAQVATTLADLHDLGFVHGRVTAEHVLIGSNRQPILCSPGHQAAGPEDDVAGLGQVLRELRDRLPPSRGSSPLNQAIAAATHPDRRRRPAARALAGTLARTPAEVAPDTRSRTLSARGLSAAAVLVVIVVGSLFLLLHRGPPHPIRFQVSEPGDPVAVGRWSCRATLPALLRPATGEVWVWDAWPRGHGQESGRLAFRIGGATSLSAVAGRPGCDTLLISRRSGPPVAIDPSPRSTATN